MILWSLGDWLSLVERDECPAGLPRRTLIVPSAIAGGVMRRLAAGRARLAAGTTILSYAQAAERVLRAFEREERIDEHDRRRTALEAIFRTELRLDYFDLELLRTHPGWSDAFAKTIGDLEAGSVRPEDLEAASPADDRGRVIDLCRIWRLADDSTAPFVSMQRACGLAADLVRAEPAKSPFAGQVRALAGPSATAAEIALLTAIPGARAARLAGRPDRASFHDRMATLLGTDESPVVAPPVRHEATEIEILGAYLFEPPARLVDAERPRSRGLDGSVSIEAYAGIDEELDAAVQWVAEQMIGGVPVNEIAVLFPSIDPCGALLADRLSALRWPGGPVPVTLDGGRPGIWDAAANRALAVIRAIDAGLSAHALADILPALRRADDTPAPGPSDAIDLVWWLGYAGGTVASRHRGLEWPARIERRIAALEAELAGVPEEEGDRRRQLDRELRLLRSILPAVRALTGVLSCVVRDEPSGAIWTAVRALVAECVLQPGGGPRIEAWLGDRLEALSEMPQESPLRGAVALRIVEEALRDLRLPESDPQRPGVFIGTIERAAGRTFEAIRVCGLVEGAYPATPRPDPVLPDASWLDAAFRRRLVTPQVRAVQQLHAFDLVVRHAKRHVALSYAATDADRTQRQPSPVLLEALAALGRTDADGTSHDIPGMRTFTRLAVAPARAAAAARQERAPMTPAAWLRLVAANRCTPPAAWLEGRAAGFERVHALLETRSPHAEDGLLDAIVPDSIIPGLTADRPVSASALQTFVACPRWMLFQNVLRLREPSGPPPVRQIGQPYYGSLVHAALSRFYAQHGDTFFAAGRPASDWFDAVEAAASAELDSLLERYPLLGDDTREDERRRLRADVRAVLEDDARARGRRFVAAEVPFSTVVEAGGPLHVHGRIDRIDRDGAALAVRDFKTSRARPRRDGEAPNAAADIQIGVYGLVAPAVVENHVGPVGAEYVHLRSGHLDVRTYRDDFDSSLAPAARDWLTAIRTLLSERLFPRTDVRDNCDYCAFKPVCGPDAWKRAGEVRELAAERLAPLRVLKEKV